MELSDAKRRVRRDARLDAELVSSRRVPAVEVQKAD